MSLHGAPFLICNMLTFRKNVLTFDPTKGVNVYVGPEYVLACCCIRDSLLFDMQHDHVLKKLNFDLTSKGLRLCLRTE